MYTNRIYVFLCFMCASYLHASCVNLLYISNARVKHNHVPKIESIIRLLDKVWETLSSNENLKADFNEGNTGSIKLSQT